MRARTAALLVGMWACALAGAVAWRRTHAPAAAAHGDSPKEVAPGVFCAGPHGRTQTNVYLVREGATWMLVDAGWEADAPRIRAAATAMLPPGSVPAAILLTHVHPDHAGSARELARDWGCPVLVHPDELGIARGDFEAMQQFAGPLDRWLILPIMRAVGRRRRETILERNRLSDLVRTLDPDGAIPGLDGWRWVHAPGHTPGHVSFVRELDRVVITGDALVTLEVNTLAGLLVGRAGLSGPPWYTTWDRAAAAASIEVIAGLEPAVLAGGHGPPLSGAGTAAAVRAFAAAGAHPPVHPAPA